MRKTKKAARKSAGTRAPARPKSVQAMAMPTPAPGITRLPGSGVTRSRVVIHGGLVYAVATAPEKSDALYDQTRQALAFLNASLALANTDKTKLLQVTVYIADIANKDDMDRAWQEWADPANAPQRACVGVALEGQDLVEIVAIAAA